MVAATPSSWSHESPHTSRAGGVVAATIEVYNSISAELLPTPSKFHYTFNLRDISKVFQGLLMISPVKCKVLTQRL